MRCSKTLLSVFLIALTSTAAILSASAQDAVAPVAPERPVELEKHGHVRTDPYFWLRERDSPEVIAYLEAENDYFEAKMAPLQGLQNELYDEIRGRIKEDDASVPYRLGRHFYYRRFEQGEQYPVYARKAGSLDGRGILGLVLRGGVLWQR